MKTQNIVIIAVAAVAAVYLLTRNRQGGPTTIIQQAPDRGTAEQILTGIGALAEGIGSGAADVARALTPTVGYSASSSRSA